MPPSQNNSITITSPLKGVIRTIAREEQPPGTAVDALNVLPYDLLDRNRIAQRFGVSEFASTGEDTFIQGMLPVGYILTPGQIVGTFQMSTAKYAFLPTGWTSSGSIITVTATNSNSTTFPTVSPGGLIIAGTFNISSVTAPGRDTLRIEVPCGGTIHNMWFEVIGRNTPFYSVGSDGPGANSFINITGVNTLPTAMNTFSTIFDGNPATGAMTATLFINNVFQGTTTISSPTALFGGYSTNISTIVIANSPFTFTISTAEFIG